MSKQRDKQFKKELIVDELIQGEETTKDINANLKQKFALHNGRKIKILKEENDKCLIEVETLSYNERKELREQWFYKNALIIIEE